VTKAGREFQVVGAAQLNDRLLVVVRLKGTWSSGTFDDLSDRIPLRAVMCWLRYVGADVLAKSRRGGGS